MQPPVFVGAMALKRQGTFVFAGVEQLNEFIHVVIHRNRVRDHVGRMIHDRPDDDRADQWTGVIGAERECALRYEVFFTDTGDMAT